MKIFSRKKAALKKGRGLVLLREVPDAMQAEKVLRKAGFSVKLVAPPPELREGCDLAVEMDIVEQLSVEHALAGESIPIVRVVPLRTKSVEPLSVVETMDFGEAIMVKVGNMKMTFDSRTGVIVNISGGGCPDVPYLHAQLIGRSLEKATRPRDTGSTLCALMLDRAFEECRRIYREE